MSCYTRHLGDLFPAGPRPEARRRLDAAVRSVVGLPQADCPEVWAAVKPRLGEADFTVAVRRAIGRDGRPQVGRVAAGGPPTARSEASTEGGGGVNSPPSPATAGGEA